VIKGRGTFGLLVILIAFSTTGAAMGGLFGSNGMPAEWVERFGDVSKLNAYAMTHAVQLSSVTISGRDLTGVKLPEASFDDTRWKEVKFERGQLGRSHVRKSVLENVSFDYSVLTDVTFEDSELRSTSFFRARLVRVKFVRCKFNGVTIDETIDSDVEIANSRILSSSLSEGQLRATIKGSTIIDVEFTDLTSPSSLTFENSELTEVDLSRSTLSSVILKNVTSLKTGVRNGKIGKLEIEGGEVAFGLSESSIDVVTVRKARIRSMSMDDAKIPELTMQDVVGTDNVGLYRAKIGVFTQERCALNDFRPRMATIGRWLLKDSSLVNSKFEEMKVGELVFQDVTLGGKLVFKGAQAEHQQLSNIKKLEDLQLNIEGSNISF